jgi:hypothetical protein
MTAVTPYFADDVLTAVVLHIPPPAEVVTLNKRVHFRTEARRKKSWRTAAQQTVEWFCPAHLLPLDPEVRWQCEVSYPVSVNRRRDPHNWIRTSKWIIDGVVTGGLLVDDDRPHLEVLDASFHAAATNPRVVVAFTRPEAS